MEDGESKDSKSVQVGRRGHHVKNKPWMSAKGREGQRAWEDNLERVRQEWMVSGIPQVCYAYAVFLCVCVQ